MTGTRFSDVRLHCLKTAYFLSVALLLVLSTVRETRATEPPSSAVFPLRNSLDFGTINSDRSFFPSSYGTLHLCNGPGDQSRKQSERQKLLKRRKEKREQQIKKLGRKYLPNGTVTILKRGAIKGNRTMDNPWKVTTSHYIVKTDISRKAAGEIALIMELFYHSFIQSPIFKADEDSHDKLPVLVAKNRKGFEENVSSLTYVPEGIKGMYVRESENRKLVTYYFNSKDMKLNHLLLHEGTHQFIDMVTKSEVPTWLNEGLASYFEYSRFQGLKLVEGVVNQARLKTVHRMIRWEARTPGKHDIIKKFSTLMRKTGQHFDGRNYAQAWSFIHFLMNWKGGQLMGKLQKYFNTYKQENVNKDPVQLFQEIFGFHPDKLYPYWRKYVNHLK